MQTHRINPATEELFESLDCDTTEIAADLIVKGQDGYIHWRNLKLGKISQLMLAMANILRKNAYQSIGI
jgi:hypothetical protein